MDQCTSQVSPLFLCRKKNKENIKTANHGKSEEQGSLVVLTCELHCYPSSLSSAMLTLYYVGLSQAVIFPSHDSGLILCI